MEFKRVCEILRNHLTSLKFGQAGILTTFSSDSLHALVDTRFAQLNTAINLELWGVQKFET
jgi:translation initiation factor 3 subunit A